MKVHALARRLIDAGLALACLALVACGIGPGLAVARALPEVRVGYGKTPDRLHDPYSDLGCCLEGTHTFMAQAIDAHRILLLEGSGYGDRAIISVELPEHGAPKLQRIPYPNDTTLYASSGEWSYPAAFHHGRHGELYVLMLPDPVNVELYTRGEADTAWTKAISATRHQLKLPIGAWAARFVETRDDAVGLMLSAPRYDSDDPMDTEGPIVLVSRGGRALESDERERLPACIASNDHYVVRDRVDSTEVLALPDSNRVMSWRHDLASRYLGMDRAGRLYVQDVRYTALLDHASVKTCRVRRLGDPGRATVEYSKRGWEFFNNAIIAPDGTLVDLEFRPDGLRIRRWTDFLDRATPR